MSEITPSTGVGTAVPRQVYNRDRHIRTPVCGGRGQLTATSAILYTAPSGLISGAASQKAVVTGIIFSNTDTVSRTITLYFIESGGSVADNRAVMKDVTIAAKTMYREPFDTPLESGETIRGLASVAAVITYRINIDELT